MQQERPPPYWRGTEQTVVVVLGHARDKLLPAHKSGLGFPRLERPGEVFVDRPLIIRKLVHAAKAEGFWQEAPDIGVRSEEHTSELQSLMRISYAVFCLKKKNITHR